MEVTSRSRRSCSSGQRQTGSYYPLALWLSLRSFSAWSSCQSPESWRIGAGLGWLCVCVCVSVCLEGALSIVWGLKVLATYVWDLKLLATSVCGLKLLATIVGGLKLLVHVVRAESLFPPTPNRLHSRCYGNCNARHNARSSRGREHLPSQHDRFVSHPSPAPILQARSPDFALKALSFHLVLADLSVVHRLSVCQPHRCQWTTKVFYW